MRKGEAHYIKEASGALNESRGTLRLRIKATISLRTRQLTNEAPYSKRYREWQCPNQADSYLRTRQRKPYKRERTFLLTTAPHS